MKHLLFLSLVVFIVPDVTHGYTPVIIWHGMGDTCCFPFSMGAIKKILLTKTSYVKSIKIGSSIEADWESGYFSRVTDQIDQVCKEIQQDEFLNGTHPDQGPIVAIGFSQGGQFVRALVQACSGRLFKGIVSIGGQQQGVYGLPKCETTVTSPKVVDSVSPFTSMCMVVRNLLSLGAYKPFVQQHLVQAQYWHDPSQEDVFRNKSLFLAKYNNQQTPVAQYKTNILNLDFMVLVMFDADTMVIPKESSHFGFYDPVNYNTIVNITETELFKSDFIGLSGLMDRGGIKFVTLPGDHLQMDMDWFKNDIVNVYL